MNQNAIRFKQNIIDCLIDAPGSRYECIYKNLLREFRQYYQTKFEEYMLRTNNQKESFSKNTINNKILFQFHLLSFTVETFDLNFIKVMLADSSQSPESLYKSMALFLGSFLMPKFVNKGLQIDEGKKVVLRSTQTGKFILTNKSSSFINELKKDE